MSSNQRPNLTTQIKASTSLRLKYAIGIGVIASLALATMKVAFYDATPQNVVVKKVSVVKITPINGANLPTESTVGARKEMAKVVQQQNALNYDKSESGSAQKQILAEQVKLLRALEDVQLKIALHADDPTFDLNLWTNKQKAIEKSLTPAIH